MFRERELCAVLQNDLRDAVIKEQAASAQLRGLKGVIQVSHHHSPRSDHSRSNPTILRLSSSSSPRSRSSPIIVSSLSSSSSMSPRRRPHSSSSSPSRAMVLSSPSSSHRLGAMQLAASERGLAHDIIVRASSSAVPLSRPTAHELLMASAPLSRPLWQ